MARALEKKFVHRENPAGYRERILQIRRFADNPWVRTGIMQRFDETVFKKEAEGGSFLHEIQIIPRFVSVTEDQRVERKKKRSR